MCPIQSRTVLLLLAMTGAAALAGQQPVPPPGAPDAKQEQRAPVLQTSKPRYQISIGDTIEISFRFTPEFNQTVTVQPDGFISLRDLSDLYIAGKTVPQLIEAVKKAYSPILHDPVVSVVLTDFEKPYFIVMGELNAPGRFELRGDTTVVEAIGIAGGFNGNAKHSQVLLFRRLSDQWTAVKKLNMKEMLKSADLSEDLHLRPGDMIYVPKNALSKIKDFIPTASVGIYAPTR